MLLNFTVESWMPYRDQASLNMTASLERQHGGTLAKLPGFRSKKALPHHCSLRWKRLQHGRRLLRNCSPEAYGRE